MLGIDKTDRRILYELDRNSRHSYSQLSTRLRIEPETVRYRVERLVDERVITNFFTLVDISRAGYAMYKIFLKLQIVSPGEVQKLIEYLARHDSVLWVVELEGPYDLGIVVRVREIIELDQFIRGLASRFNHCIARRVFSVNIYGEYLPRAQLIGKDTRENNPLCYSAAGGSYPLDSAAIGILRSLGNNSRASTASIAEHLKRLNVEPLIAPEAVGRRIKKLESDQVITGYSIMINNERINRFRFKLLLYMNELKDKTMQAFLAFLRKQMPIVYFVRALGEWDYEIDIEADEITASRETLLGLMRAFPDAIRDHSTLMISKTHKYNYFP